MTWRKRLVFGLTDVEKIGLSKRLAHKLKPISNRFPMKIPPEIISLVDLYNTHCPIRRQVVPNIRELDEIGQSDPLEEEQHWVTPGVVQRFPDRLLALVSSCCPIHCRHCNRKRYWKGGQPVAGPDELLTAVRKRPKTREIILSGGDPLMLSDRRLGDLLHIAHSSPNIELVRIHSRIPFSMPSRLTTRLVQLLKRYQPLWFVVQFNHAKELGDAQRNALLRLRSAGIPVLNQAVLLRGINDTVQAQHNLGRALLSVGVKPHYLFQLDHVLGTLHFQVPISKARTLINRLRSKYSGLLIPHLLLDLPGHHGKVPTASDAMIESNDHGVWFRTSDGNRIFYPEYRTRNPTILGKRKK